jgi:hypothetical protein
MAPLNANVEAVEKVPACDFSKKRPENVRQNALY